MFKPSKFLVDIGSIYYKMGFSGFDCTILEKTPPEIFDSNRNIKNLENYCNLIISKLNYEINQNIEFKNKEFDLIIASRNDKNLLNCLFKSTNLIKKILFANPNVMDLYSTGKTTGIIFNISDNYLDSAIIQDSKIIYENFKNIKNSDSVIQILKSEFNQLFTKIENESKTSILGNVILCGGKVNSHEYSEFETFISSKSKNFVPKLIIDHSIFSTYTGLDILCIGDTNEGFITRRNWEEYGDKCIDKYGIEWYK